MFPGAGLDWTTEQLVYPDGRRQSFHFRIYQERPQPTAGATLLIASPSPEHLHAKAVAQLQTFRGPQADLPRCKLQLIRVDAAGKVRGYKESVPDVGVFTTTCDKASFL